MEKDSIMEIKEEPDEPNPVHANYDGTFVSSGGGLSGKINEHPFGPGLLLGRSGDRLSCSKILPVFIKSPACKSVGFSRCDRFSWVWDNNDISA